MPDKYIERRVIEWTEDVREAGPVATYTMRRITGKRRMRAEVDVIVNVAEAARMMGKRACVQKTRQCRDGVTLVRCVTEATEVSREMIEHHG